MLRFFFLIAILGIFHINRARGSDFQLRNNDVVAFFGDSNTAWGSFPKIIENYTRSQNPSWKIKFINAGVPGDALSAGYYRLKPDVFAHHPTVVFVMFGINDFNWGLDQSVESINLFMEYTLKTVRLMRQKKIRVYILSYPVVEKALISVQNGLEKNLEFISRDDNSFMQQIGDRSMEISLGNGGRSIDVERAMRRDFAQALEENPSLRFHKPDGVHLNDLGNASLARAILQGLGASLP